MRIDIPLHSDSADWFEDRRERYGERHRGGNLPSRPEFIRILLEDSDAGCPERPGTATDGH